MADLIEEHADELGMADTRDMGKPISQSRGNDVPRSASNFRFFADHAKMSTADALPMDSGHHTYTRSDPTGVVSAIAPWNFPLMMETWRVIHSAAWESGPGEWCRFRSNEGGLAARPSGRTVG